MTTISQNAETSIEKTACGGVMQDPSEYPSAMYKGERVYFCNKACMETFLQAPEAFMAGEVEHPLEDETA